MRGAALLLLFAVICVATLVVASPNYFFRYFGAVIPVLCIFGGRILESAMRIHFTLGIAALIGVLCLGRLPDYGYEITHHLTGPTEGIVQFLNAHAAPGDVVGVNLGDLPIKFYTNLRVVGGLTGEDLTPIRKARWIVARNGVVCDKDLAVLQYMLANLREADYRRYQIDFPDVRYDNRECPDEHQYRTVSAAPRVVIRERIVP